jgi:hypothetical protein
MVVSVYMCIYESFHLSSLFLHSLSVGLMVPSTEVPREKNAKETHIIHISISAYTSMPSADA